MGRAYTIFDLQEIVARLRGENGCPWDRVQTHESLERCMIEEAYEAVEGIHLLKETGDSENLCEELGDVLLQVVFHSQLAEEEGLFDMSQVIQGISEKMIRRHPHVFAENQAENADQVRQNWDEIKKKEKEGKRDQRSELEAVPHAFPALIRAQKVQKKIIKGGYEQELSMEELYRESQESLKKLSVQDTLSSEEAFKLTGELLYQICRMAGRYGIHAEEALKEKVEQEVAFYTGSDR